MLCSQAGFKPILNYEAIHTKTIINLVAANLGVAIVPASISYNKNTYVNFLPIKDTNIQLETAVIWYKGSISEVLENFINTLFKTANVKA
jgi:DNA-binding transcriptional LysR family regulator